MSHSELVKLVICSLLILIAGAHIPIHMAPTLATVSLVAPPPPCIRLTMRMSARCMACTSDGVRSCHLSARERLS